MGKTNIHDIPIMVSGSLLNMQKCGNFVGFGLLFVRNTYLISVLNNI